MFLKLLKMTSVILWDVNMSCNFNKNAGFELIDSIGFACFYLTTMDSNIGGTINKDGTFVPPYCSLKITSKKLIEDAEVFNNSTDTPHLNFCIIVNFFYCAYFVFTILMLPQVQGKNRLHSAPSTFFFNFVFTFLEICRTYVHWGSHCRQPTILVFFLLALRLT